MRDYIGAVMESPVPDKAGVGFRRRSFHLACTMPVWVFPSSQAIGFEDYLPQSPKPLTLKSLGFRA